MTESKLRTQQLRDTPYACWVCGELTTEHHHGIVIHDKCLAENYPEVGLLYKEIEIETDT
jgi:hypothetical protein